MTKKKALALSMAAILTVMAVVGASLAYLTDSREVKNTFTVGKVQIELVEQQKGEDGLEDFEQDKTLLPGTSSSNAVSKIVTVKNTGANDAWVWVDLYIPAYLVSSAYKTAPHTDDSQNALHWNSYGCFNVEYNESGYARKATEDGIIDEDGKVTDSDMVAVEDGLWYDYRYIGTTDDGAYVIVRSKMKNTLPAGKTSLPVLAQVYMDWRVYSTVVDDVESYVLPDGTTIAATASWQIDIKAYAIQADGIADVDTAISYYSQQFAD